MWQNNLAVMYQAHKKDDEAGKLYDQARKLSQEKGWTSHFWFAVMSSNYAKLIQSLGDRTFAKGLYKEIEKIYRDKHGEYYKYYQVADFLSDYGQFFLEATSCSSALPLVEQAIDIYSCQKPCLGHDKVVDTLEAYVKCHQHTHGHQAPDALYRQVLNGFEPYRDHAQLANVQCSFASYLKSRDAKLAQHYYEEAFRNYNLALHDYLPMLVVDENDGWIQSIPKDSSKSVDGRVIQVLVNFEKALNNYWRLESVIGEGEKQYRKAKALFEGLLVEKHWLLGDFYGGYCGCLSKAKDPGAEALRRQAGEIRRMYPLSTYQDQKHSRTLAWIW
jgi:tetratricopeptide (TPR) repeat protein